MARGVRAGVAAHRHGQRADLPRVIQRRDAIGRIAARRNGHDDVVFGQRTRLEISHGQLAAVFRALDGIAQRRVAARDDALHQLGRYAKRRRTFGRVQHAQPAACARAHVDQPAALFHARDDRIDRLGQRGQRPRHARGHVGGHVVHQRHDLQRAHLIEPFAARVHLLGRQRGQKRFRIHDIKLLLAPAQIAF